MLAEPALAWTDFVLGAVIMVLAWRLHARDGVARPWFVTFCWLGTAAMAGFVHHGFVAFSDTAAEVGIVIVSALVVIAVSCLLAATVHEILGPGRQRVFWTLRLTSVAAYAGLAAAGRPGPSSIVIAESVTMVLILALWLRALTRGHPLAPGVVVAFLASATAAAAQALPESLTRLVGLDPVSLYHLAQIPGVALLYRALVAPPRHPRVDAGATVSSSRAMSSTS